MPKSSNTLDVQYTISELSKQFDVTSRALRLYEESELLSPKRVGTKRIYSERDRVRLRLIMRGKRLGWSLSEIREIFDIYDTDSGEKTQLEFFLQRLDDRIKILERQREDVLLSLKDVSRIKEDAQRALEKIIANENKLKSG